VRARAIGSVLVVVTRQIGDVLLTTPLIHEAKRLWPDAAVDVLGFEGTLGMLRGNADVRELIATPARLGWRGAWRMVRRLWKRYDLVLVAEASDRAHLFGWIAGRQRAGIIAPQSSSTWWKRRLLDHSVVAAGDRGETHVVQEKLALLAPWSGTSPVPAQVVPPGGEPLPVKLAAQLRGSYVVVHAPSMWAYKQWPVAHFQHLVAGLLAAGQQVVLTGGPGESDRACVAAVRSAAPAAIDAGVLNFNQLASLISGAALYIGPDTSVSHLAAATGTPVLAIFGPTNPMRWAPWPAKGSAAQIFARSSLVQQAGNVTLLQSALPCVPCGRAGCEDHRDSRSDCLVDIDPQRVLAQALELLSGG
jgi:heptosyltransferase-3